MKRYFVTGTDTDCGKTYITCQLLNFLNQSGQKAQALKPVASGSRELNGGLINEDVLTLQQYNNQPLLDINYRQYAPPISPHLAARECGDLILAADVANFCDRPEFAGFDYLLVEGAGGLLAPLNDNETWLDFLYLTQMPVILVVGLRLGCINHALLTAAALEASHISCFGWIANSIDPDMLARDANIATLSSRLPIPHLATVFFDGGISIPALRA